jgi:hypothetical protein
MKGVLICFPTVQSCAGSGNFDGASYILFIDKPLKEFQRLEDSERTKVAMPFIVNPFQERDVVDSAELVSSMFKENVWEVELEIVCKEMSKEIRINDTNFWNFVQSA